MILLKSIKIAQIKDFFLSIKVSVVIPVYNTALYLEQCLDSLINQTLQDIEIICINDGSTDESLSILDRYKNQDKRIRVFNQENKGQSAARNLGINRAQGEYIGFLDSDDFAKPEMFEKLYGNAKSNDSDITMCSIEVFNEKTQQTTEHDPYLSLDIFNKSFENRVFSHYDCSDFLFRICVTPWNKIFKRELIDKNKISFIEGVNFEDNVFCLETLLRAGKITIIKEPLVVYRKESETSYSFGHNDYKKLDFFKITEFEENVLKESSFYEKYRDYFEFHKKNLLFYWYQKIHAPVVKGIYFLKLSSIYPFFMFEKLKEKYFKLEIQKNLKDIVKTKKVIIWGASKYASEIAAKIKSDNMLGFVDINPQMHGKKIIEKPVYSVDELNLIKPDAIIAISKNYYHFDKLIQNDLRERNIDIPVINYSTYS